MKLAKSIRSEKSFSSNPGIWLFHCHELHHADGGMIVPIVYE